MTELRQTQIDAIFRAFKDPHKPEDIESAINKFIETVFASKYDIVDSTPYPIRSPIIKAENTGLPPARVCKVRSKIIRNYIMGEPRLICYR